MILDELTVSVADFATRTGWVSKPQGLCKGDMCVPASEAVDGDRLDVSVLSQKLGMPLLHDDATGVYALGPEGMGHSLTSATVPILELPDSDGNPFLLSSLHGKKVLLVVWASW